MFAIDPLPPRPASVDSGRDNIVPLPRSPPHPHPQAPAHHDDEDVEGGAHEVSTVIHVCVFMVAYHPYRLIGLVNACVCFHGSLSSLPPHWLSEYMCVFSW